MLGLFVLGTGLLAEEFLALAEESGQRVEAFVENRDRQKDGRQLHGRPVIWLDRLPQGARCVCALSTTKREEFIRQVEGRAEFVTLVHPSSSLLPPIELGPGSVVSTGVLVGSHVAIGRHVFLNRGARVGHHTHIADFVTVQPGSNIAGACTIGPRTYIGMGAIVIERLRIGTGVTIAAGALVKDDVPDHTMVAGSPASVKKVNVEPP